MRRTDVAPPSAGLSVEDELGSTVEADGDTEPGGAGLGLRWSRDVVHPVNRRRTMTAHAEA